MVVLSIRFCWFPKIVICGQSIQPSWDPWGFPFPFKQTMANHPKTNKLHDSTWLDREKWGFSPKKPGFQTPFPDAVSGRRFPWRGRLLRARSRWPSQPSPWTCWIYAETRKFTWEIVMEMEVSYNGGTPFVWMVYFMEHLKQGWSRGPPWNGKPPYELWHYGDDCGDNWKNRLDHKWRCQSEIFHVVYGKIIHTWTIQWN